MIEKYRAIFDQMELTDLLSGVLAESGYEAKLRTNTVEDTTLYIIGQKKNS